MNTGKTTCSETFPTGSAGINRGVIIMIASVLCFTANTLLLKYLGSVRVVSPSVAMLFRAVVGSLIVLTFFRGKGTLEISQIFRDRRLIARGVMGVLGTSAYYVTVPAMGAGKASILCNTYVLFAVLIASFAIGETLRKRQIFWISVAFVGITLLVGNGEAHAKQTLFPGFNEFIAIGGALCAATTVVLIRSLTKRFSNGTIFMTQCLWVGIAVLPFAIPALKEINGYDAFFLVCAGVMAGCGQMLLNEGFRRLTVALGSSIQMAWPLLTAVGGFFLFGETFTVLQLVGSALILGGIFQVRKTK